MVIKARTRIVTEIIDGDGHIVEEDEQIRPYLQAKYPEENLRSYYLFPTLDGWRRGMSDRGPGWDAAGWQKFLDQSGISSTVLYPTVGLGFGFVRDRQWAVDLAHAYNDYVFNHFLKVDSRLKAVAIIPVQDPPEAAKELRRAVKELGMVGGLLPAVGLARPYGDSTFDPLYQEAQALDTLLAVHGAPRQGIGPDYMNADNGMGFVLAHPFSQMMQFTNMVFERTFERFPNMKVAFLEAGAGWVPYLIERIDRRAKHRQGRRLATEQVRNCPIYFHAELEEHEVLPLALSVVGDDRFVYASDYPHESAKDVEEALEEFLERQDVSAGSKQKILCDNIKAMYGMR